MDESFKDMEPDRPLVSIITVTLNSQDYLEETIQSVVNQTYRNIEYIIIDGGSTDDTLNIIQRYKDKIACWRSEPDQNMYDAINKGISLSKGDIIAVLNSDDKYAGPEVIEQIVMKFLKYPQIDGFYGDIIKLYQNHIRYKRLFQVNFEKYLLSRKGTFVPHITLFIKKEPIRKVGLYNIQYNYAADYDFILRCLKHCRLRYINRPLACFRIHSKSITASGKICYEKLAILKDHRIEQYSRYYALLIYIYLWSKYLMLNLLNKKHRLQIA